MHKKGSWMQNWWVISVCSPSHCAINHPFYSRKKRYFVLRKDIRSICYYDSRESLTLLGSIPLDSETQISHVAPKDASK